MFSLPPLLTGVGTSPTRGLPTVAGCFAFGACQEHHAHTGHREPFDLLTTLGHRVILRLQRELLCEIAEGRADVRMGMRGSAVLVDDKN